MNINGLTKNKIQEFKFLYVQANDQQLPAMVKMLENEIRKRQMIAEASLFIDEADD